VPNVEVEDFIVEIGDLLNLISADIGNPMANRVGGQ